MKIFSRAATVASSTTAYPWKMRKRGMREWTAALLFLLCAALGAVPARAAENSTEITLEIPEKAEVSVEIRGNGSITVENGENTEVIRQEGTVFVEKGQDVVFRFHPAEGSRLTSVLYQGKEIKNQIEKQSWTLKNVQESGTIAVIFAVSSGQNEEVETGDYNRYACYGLLAAVCAAATAILWRKKQGKYW